jgi:peptidoglycan/LPS O-acetylase OafA/YrhL
MNTKSGKGRPHRRRYSFVREHSLSIASAGILVLWICLYSIFGPKSHIGSFFGNAIADWSGVVVMVFATKYLFEKGSAESRRPPRTLSSPIRRLLHDHSLSMFLVVTGIGWIALYMSMESETKWGQVVGNIVSEWTQIFGLVLLTKRLIERHSRESDR